MQRGWDAHSNPDFYIPIDKDPQAITDKALAIIERKFINAKDDKPAPVDHSASNKLIADAEAGMLPPPPDFSAPTHARFGLNCVGREVSPRSDAAELGWLRVCPTRWQFT